MIRVHPYKVCACRILLWTVSSIWLYLSIQRRCQLQFMSTSWTSLLADLSTFVIWSTSATAAFALAELHGTTQRNGAVVEDWIIQLERSAVQAVNSWKHIVSLHSSVFMHMFSSSIQCIAVTKSKRLVVSLLLFSAKTAKVTAPML